MNIVHAQRRWSWAWRPKEGTNLCRTSSQPLFRFLSSSLLSWSSSLSSVIIIVIVVIKHHGHYQRASSSVLKIKIVRILSLVVDQWCHSLLVALNILLFIKHFHPGFKDPYKSEHNENSYCRHDVDDHVSVAAPPKGDLLSHIDRVHRLGECF